MSQNKFKNYIIVGFVFFAILVLGTFGYFYFAKNEPKDILGTVIATGDGYVILESTSGDFIYETSTNYDIGMSISLRIMKEDTTSMPTHILKGEVLQVTAPKNDATMSGSVSIEQDSEVQEKPIESPNDPINNPESFLDPIDDDPYEETSSDAIVLSYLNEMDSSLEEPQENFLKNGFITVVDFLFYQGTIRGVRLADITLKTKLIVLKFALKVDQKIEEYFPQYKENISKTTKRIYTGIREKVITLYLNTTTKICQSNSSLCETAKNDFQSLKSSFGITWSLIKDFAVAGVGNLKDWYEIFSGK